MLLIAAIALLAGSALPTGAQTPPPQDPRAAQFDFWVGVWDLTSGDKPAGTNTITKEFDGAVIMEHFSGIPQPGLNGMSVSVFNPATGKWHQTWVDNQAGYLDFVGEFADGKMILSRHANRAGKDFLQRMVWSNIGPDSFDWSWERSDDNGATWQVVWPIHYTRKK
ncbi:MAG TPA: hypothetical protein VFX92_06485 [Candidatus Krumholzibacteria bacterium]|nr:hypothetical protein [Candidatus Krumholzibacteria bacterium]